MNDLKVIGEINVGGKTIKHIEGGFGEGCRIITAKDIALEHEVELKDLNGLINDNITRFTENDLINLLKGSEPLREFAKENGLIGSNRTKDVFVLSERGYTKLVAMMSNSNEKKWEVMDKLIDEYFTMREVINSDEQLKAMYLLKAVESNGEESAIAIKMYSDLRIKEENKKLTDKLTNEVINPLKRDLEHTEDVVLSLTSNISLMEKRQRITQIVRYGSKKYAERYTLLYEEFSKKFHVDIRRRLENAKERGDIKKSVNMMEYICSEKYLNKTNELYDVCCKLFEGDFIKLLDEWRETVSK